MTPANIETTTRWRRLCSLVLLVSFALAACNPGDNDGARRRGDPSPPSSRRPKPSFRFVAIGDFGTGEPTEKVIADRMREWVDRFGADAFVTMGDNVYPDGGPDNFRRAWTVPYGWVERRGIRVLASLGNDDIKFDGGAALMELLDMPARWYQASLKNADLFVLDATQIEEPAQIAWLRQALSESRAAWQVAVFHRPAFSCATIGNTPPVIENWVPLFERHGVDLALSGDDHAYQRFRPVKGVTYVVSGGGGADLIRLGECGPDTPPLVATNDDLHHFVAVQGTRACLRVSAIARDGSIIDTFALEAPQARNGLDCDAALPPSSTASG
jgi:hypothetical protein